MSSAEEPSDPTAEDDANTIEHGDTIQLPTRQGQAETAKLKDVFDDATGSFDLNESRVDDTQPATPARFTVAMSPRAANISQDEPQLVDIQDESSVIAPGVYHASAQPKEQGDVQSNMEALSLNKQSDHNPLNNQNALDLSPSEVAPTQSQTEGIHRGPPQSLRKEASTMPSPSATPSQESEWNEKEPYEPAIETTIQSLVDRDFGEKKSTDGETTEDSKAEIQSIMAQFTGDKAYSAEPTSPTKEFPVFQYPPRTSSLEHVQGPSAGDRKDSLPTSPSPASKDPDRASLSYAASIRSQPPPPEPDPEPDLPFDFHRFLEQLRHKSADPVAKFLRSFLLEFGKKQWQVHEQQKIIGDFLAFISNRMAQCDVWRTVSDAEFDNAKEGMEKLVMNRLHTQTFSPEIPASEPSPVKGRRKGNMPLLGPGRKGQHQEDVERDEVLAQKVRIYGWIREEHLDIKPFGDKGRKFLLLAQQELAKIKSYRAPRDKVICVLNSCKVIFGYLRNAQADQSADTFIPLLIYTVLKAKPDHLVSNVQYILRFRNQDKLGGEAGYYMSSLMGAVQFIENLDRTNLTVSDEEFDKNVEIAVSEIAARNEVEERRHVSYTSIPPSITTEKAAPSRPEVTPRHSTDGERSSMRRTTSSEDPSDNERAAVTGLLRSIQRPLSSIGRIFSDDSTSTFAGVRPLTPQSTSRPTSRTPAAMQPGGRPRMVAEDAAARQASAKITEVAETQADHQTVVETLAGMFPDLDRDIISDVVRMKGGRIGLAVDACLALSR